MGDGPSGVVGGVGGASSGRGSGGIGDHVDEEEDGGNNVVGKLGFASFEGASVPERIDCFRFTGGVRS